MKRERGLLKEGPSSQRLIALRVARYPQRMTRPLQIGFIGGGLNSAVGKTHRIAAELDGRWKLAAGFFSRDATINKGTGVEVAESTAKLLPVVQQQRERDGKAAGKRVSNVLVEKGWCTKCPHGAYSVDLYVY